MHVVCCMYMLKVYLYLCFCFSRAKINRNAFYVRFSFYFFILLCHGHSGQWYYHFSGCIVRSKIQSVWQTEWTVMDLQQSLPFPSYRSASPSVRSSIFSVWGIFVNAGPVRCGLYKIDVNQSLYVFINQTISNANFCKWPLLNCDRDGTALVHGRWL